MLELGIGYVVVLLLHILAWLHQLGHLVTVEDLLLLLRTSLTPYLALSARHLLSAFFLHPLLAFSLHYWRVLVAEVLEEVGTVVYGVGVEVA